MMTKVTDTDQDDRLAVEELSQLIGTDWSSEAKRILKAEMKRRGFTYSMLRERLEVMGIQETEPNLRNKVSRGAFTAAFLLQCLTAMGSRGIRLGDL